MRPRLIFEAAAGAGGMSIEDFALTDEYKAGVADGSIVEWVRTGPSHGDASGPAFAEAAADPEPQPHAAKAKHTKSA